jgi:hypothetical protein
VVDAPIMPFFATIVVNLQLAYNRGNFMRTLTIPRERSRCAGNDCFSD